MAYALNLTVIKNICIKINISLLSVGWQRNFDVYLFPHREKKKKNVSVHEVKLLKYIYEEMYSRMYTYLNTV